jgi:hypothetical protein
METTTRIGRRQLVALGGAALAAMTLATMPNRAAAEDRTPPPATPEASPEAGMTQTRVRFAVDDTEIIVRIADNPTSRDLLSLLPLTLQFQEFSGMEKISYLPRELTIEGSASATPENGDLIYFVPWGNLGFFYNAERRDKSYDDRVILIGKVETGFELLENLETGSVQVEVVPDTDAAAATVTA